MPSSKRKNPVPLTSCKKDSSKKHELVHKIRNTFDELIKNENSGSAFVYLISLNNQRNAPLKSLRTLLWPGRVFYGNNRVMRVALGTKPENEIQENIHQLSNNLVGETAILITSEGPEVVINKVLCFKVRDFSKSGRFPTETIVFKEGGEDFKDIPGSMEPQFRRLGMPTSLNMGKIVLMGDFVVCEKDKRLSPSQSQILKLLGLRMSLFTANVTGFWTNGHYTDVTPNTHSDNLM